MLLQCRRPLAVLLAGLLLAACTSRQPHPLPERADIPFGHGRLWQVEGEGIRTSYVFATLRAGDKRLYRIPEAVDSALQGSDIAAFDEVRDPLSGDSFSDIERLKLPDGESLADLIGARSFGILTWHMKRSELRPKDNIRPWAFWLYMGGPNWGFVDYDSLYSHRSERFFDDWMVDEARRVPMKVVGLQTDREAFDRYNEMPLDLQAAMLKVMLERYSESEPEVAKAQLYLNGDLATLDALWREYLGWLPPATAQALHEWLIVSPNRIMVERMIPLMQQGVTFVSVEALHLPGEQGILRLLERRGFTVTRLH